MSASRRALTRPAPPRAEPWLDCPLCGLRFAEEAARCGRCPLNPGCAAICCPGCGYEFVHRSATADAARRLAAGLRGWLGRWGSGRRRGE